MSAEREYKNTKAWNPFVGCNYQCTYCKPSYQRVVARSGRCLGCENCQTYTPHEHEERLSRVPSAKTIFVCSSGDIAFAREEFAKRIFEAMRQDKREGRTWLVQSKNPSCFENYLDFLPENTYLITTLETNRDEGYERISRAPKPSARCKDFLDLEWDKKIVTVEPIIDFELEPFSEMLVPIEPEVVFIGYNSKPTSAPLPEPTWDNTLGLMYRLRSAGITVLPKLIPKKAYKDYFENMRRTKATIPLHSFY